MIPISAVQFGDEEERQVLDVLRSGAIAQGAKVEELENVFGRLFDAPNVIAVNSGTSALIAALHVLDLRPGDEVITTPFTFAATLNAILQAGATAVFADINATDFNIDPAAVAERVSPNTRVLLPVHLYGQMADMAPLESISNEHGLRIVEDAAQSHGASYQGRYAGSYGLGTFSLYATKNITTGEGGLITTSDDALASRLRVLRNQGMRKRYQYEMPGNNYRLTDLQAALGIPQLHRYARTVCQRQRNAQWLIEGLEHVPGVVVPQQLNGRNHVWHQFTVRITADARVRRDQFVEQLAERGVTAGVYYPRLVFDFDAYRSHERVRASNVPVAAKVAAEVLSLPVHTALSEADLDHIVASVRAVAGV
jgi:perosamine synthetase